MCLTNRGRFPLEKKKCKLQSFLLCALGAAPCWAGANPTGAGSAERPAWLFLFQVRYNEPVRVFISTICPALKANKNKVSQGMLYVSCPFWAHILFALLFSCYLLPLISVILDLEGVALADKYANNIYIFNSYGCNSFNTVCFHCLLLHCAFHLLSHNK